MSDKSVWSSLSDLQGEVTKDFINQLGETFQEGIRENGDLKEQVAELKASNKAIVGTKDDLSAKLKRSHRRVVELEKENEDLRQKAQNRQDKVDTLGYSQGKADAYDTACRELMKKINESGLDPANSKVRTMEECVKIIAQLAES